MTTELSIVPEQRCPCGYVAPELVLELAQVDALVSILMRCPSCARRGRIDTTRPLLVVDLRPPSTSSS